MNTKNKKFDDPNIQVGEQNLFFPQLSVVFEMEVFGSKLSPHLSP
jgi:hypothetical protein